MVQGRGERRRGTVVGVWLSAGSGPSTYPADRDFKGHVGGVRGAAPQGFFLFFPYFFVRFQGEKGCINEYITNFRLTTQDVVSRGDLSELFLFMCPSPLD